MANRSCVCIAISYTVLIPDDVRKAMSDASSTYRNHYAHYWYWDWVKWYENDPDYPDVTKIMKFLSELDDEEYGFVIVGDYGQDTAGHPHQYEIGYSVVLEKPF